MLVVGFDTETTGVDVTKDTIVQVGLVLWDTSAKVKKSKLKYDALLRGAPPMDQEVIDIHGITDADLEEYGEDPKKVFGLMHDICMGADAIIAHNGNGFDKPMYLENCTRLGIAPIDKLWIDTMCDIEYPVRIQTRKLTHLAAEHGFLNPFPHDAISDVLTMLKIADQYDWDKTVLWAQTPSIVVQACVTFHEKELAKAQQYRWNAPDKTWVKTIKSFQLEEVQKAAADAGFKIVVKG